MRVVDLFEYGMDEDAVASSWIADLALQDNGNIDMTVFPSGRSYTVFNAGEELFDQWMAAASKGQFWHQFVRNFFPVI